MKNLLYDFIDIVPEVKRRRFSSRSSSSSSGGFFSMIGNFFRSISRFFMFGILMIIALILLPFILIRNRRSQSNDVFINHNDNAGNTSLHKTYSSSFSKSSDDKIIFKK